VTWHHSLIVDINAPGRYDSFGRQTERIPYDGAVDSYLIHWDTTDDAEKSKRVTSRITFRRPILGLIVTERRLIGTDSMFRSGSSKYSSQQPSKRALESASNVMNGDRVVLSEDRLTLDVDFQVSLAMDEIRVLVTAAPAEER
jgi:hypothetical protein